MVHNVNLLHNNLIIVDGDPLILYLARLHSAVGSISDCRSRGHKLESQLGHITFVEFDNEIISMVFLSLPLIQEGLLSVTGESVHKYW